MGATRQLGHLDLFRLDHPDQPMTNWKRYMHYRKPDRSLVTSIGMTFAPEFLVQAALTLIRCIVRYASPFFLQRILRSIENSGSSEKISRGAYIHAFGLLFFSLLNIAVTNQSMWIGRRIGMRLKGLLVAELSTKTLCRGAGKDVSKIGSTASNGKIMNLLTADLKQVTGVISYLDNIIATPITFFIGVWYMYRMLGISALIGLSITAVYAPLSKKFFAGQRQLKKKQSASSDERVSVITELLQGIKSVKLFGWESRLIQKVDERRERQLDYAWKISLWKTAINISASLSPMLLLAITFTAYVALFGNKMTAEIAFTSISVLQMVRTSMVKLPKYTDVVINGYVALGRIDSYLSQPQIQDLEEHASSMVSLDGQNNNSVFSLKYIDVQFPIGGLSIVAGPTGCGKSSLLSALIGEMTLTHGHVLLPTVDASMIAASNSKYRDVIELSNEGLAICDIAYVAQKAWLRNATIRENILFGEPYDKDRYEEVLHACALKPDLRILKAGDMTEIGERGVTLSGGQQQRVALARAVYSSRRILLIDDCLSAVDAHTGKHILMECLLNKTSLMKDRTRVLVTHHVAMCLPFAQFLVVMKDGQIMLKGCPTDLEMRGLISGTLLDKQHKDNSTTDDSSDKTKNGIDPNSNLSALQGILVDEEKREEGYVKFEVWKTYILACGNKFFWMSIMIILIISELILALSKYWIRVWVASTSNSIIGFHTTDTANIQLKHHSSAYWLGIYVLIGILHTAWSAAMWLVIFFGSLKASRDIHKRLIRSIMHATPRFFDTTPIGRIINRFSGDMHTIDNGALDSIVIECTTRVISVLTIYVIVSWILPLFAIVAVTITLVYAGIAYYYLNASRELKRLESNSMSPLLSLFSELIQGVSTIRAFGTKHYYIQESLNYTNGQNRAYYMVWAANRWLSVRIGIASTAVSFICTLFILSNIAWIDAGLAGFILSYALVFSEKMLMLIREYSSSEMKMNSVERIRQYLSIEQEAALESELGHEPPASWPTKGDLQIENLVAEYMPGVPVLHSISLSVKHGEKIGVVGRTGAGKSTLSLALLRFVEASSGCILLDGVDISKIGLEELRRSVTIVPQDPVLFNGTIRFNLDPFNEYPDVILWDALRRTHLVRENSSQNTNAEIKENGQNLSLGQRQLVALARALVRRSRLIIMDEATASVDFDTDDRIQRTIRGYEFANSTLLCIAHRLRTIIDYDRVLVLDNGKVAEFDTPYSLLQNKGGIFRNMCTNSGEYENLLVTAGRKRSTGS
ncbi:P-loop containing nucleoside triphosphate hydrolase protein [Coemansia spiralis]|nr:P-loop containing nucleoside triphosphate hydrolase protein [Coemansia spiralis]